MKRGRYIQKIFIGTFAVVLLLTVLFFYSGCSKEYSVEATPINPADTITIPPPPPPPNELPPCKICSTYTDPIELGHWSLKAENSLACGIIDTAIMNLERTSFTFFGPSACSEDTGMVVTAYIENFRLNQDMTSGSINRIAFYYYDRVKPSYIYISSQASPFAIRIENYNHQTRILTGTFEGNAFRANNTSARISSGRFKIKLL
jgi:hypothetical protein